MSKQPPPAPTASAVGPCPTAIQIVGRPGTGSLPSTIAPPAAKGEGWDPPFIFFTQDTVLPLLPSAPRATRLWETFNLTFTFTPQYSEMSVGCAGFKSLFDSRDDPRFNDSV